MSKKYTADRAVMIGGRHRDVGSVLDLDSGQCAHLRRQGIALTSTAPPPAAKPVVAAEPPQAPESTEPEPAPKPKRPRRKRKPS